MTQLDLPPISFARYVDLLKRRRWHVVPVSVAGLLIGALVAFLIPRYYVAQTTVRFDSKYLPGFEPESIDDPMEPVLQSAELSILFSAHDALVKLGWPEVVAGDVEARRQFEEDVRSRITVVDIEPKRGRRNAHLRISYRDTDGQRAMELTNKLLEVWIEGAQRDLEAAARQHASVVNRDIKIADDAVVEADKELENFERSHAIDPTDWTATRDGGRGDKAEERDRLAAAIEAGDTALKLARRQLEFQKGVREDMPEKIQRIEKGEVPEELKKVFSGFALEILRLETLLRTTHASHPDRPLAQVQLEEWKKKDADLRKLLLIDRVEFVENERRVEVQERIDDLEMEIAKLEAELERDRRREAALTLEIAALSPIARKYRELLDRKAAAIEHRDDLKKENDTAQANLRVASQGLAYQVKDEARVPPRPTEPNITLVALAGSAVGLAVAIGLILLIDILQSTFKTVHDVEHLLPVPVLGRISHMETPEQRRDVQTRRTRAGLVAGGFLVLAVSLITIYYVRPATLPALVRDTLDLILGAPASERAK